MRKKMSVVLFVIFLLIVMSFALTLPIYSSDGLSAGFVAGSSVDWWPMFHHDLLNTGYSTSLAPHNNHTLWIHQLGDWVRSSPTVYDGVVYVGSDENKIYALEATTGQEIWNYTVGADVTTCPAIADGKVYFGSADDYLYCLDATIGDLVWKYKTGRDVLSSPKVTQGKVLFGSNDHKIYALDASTGNHLWNFSTGGYVQSSPAISSGRVFFGSKDQNIYALDLNNGSSIWTRTLSIIIESPAVSDGKVFVPSGSKIYCLKETNGDSIWEYTTGGSIYSSPAVANGRVFVGSNDYKLYCLDAANGHPKWSFPTDNSIHSSPAVAEGKVFFGSEDHKIYCLNATTGEYIWSYDTGGRIIFSSPAVANKTVLIGSCISTSTGKIYAFRNTPPIASNLTITPSLPVTTNDLVGSYDYYDANGDPEHGTQTRWYKNDTLQPALNDKLTVSSSLTTKGETWYFTVTPKDGTEFGYLQTSPSVTIRNSPPTAYNLAISPSTPYTTDDLVGSYTYYDPDNDAESGSEIRWYRNHVLQSAYNNTLTIPHNETTKDESWYFTIRPKDGIVFGELQTSPSVTIHNSPPFASDLTVTPTSPLTTDDLTGSYFYSDADGDLESGTEMRWYKNDVLMLEYNDTLTIPSSATSKSQVWYFTVKPQDGIDFGDLQTSPSVTIQNTPPSLAVLEINPDPAYTTNTLTATPTGWFDADGDPEGYTYQWQMYEAGSWQNISGATHQTLEPENFVKGDQIKNICTPYDGEAYGTSQEDTITILNSPPLAPAVDITPDPPITTDDLVCAITTPSIDPDDDPLTYFYAWYENDILQLGLATNIVDSSYTARGEVWKCVVTPYDGTINGTFGQDEVIVGNAPPSVEGVNITPDPACTSDTLTAISYGWYDADGDSEGYIYQWEKWVNGTWQDITGATSETLTSDNFIKGDQLKVICTPFDGTDYGTSKENTITIQNSPPTIDLYYPLTDPTIIEGESQEFNITKSDPDFDTLTVEWYLNGTQLNETSDSYIHTSELGATGKYNITVTISDNSSQANREWILTVRSIIHDVAVTDIASYKTIVGQGYFLYVNITVENRGDLTENFNVTAYANTTTIEKKEMTLTSGNSTTVIFTWNTTGIAKGNYTITANATVVPSETYIIDNTLTDGWVIVAMPGDITGLTPNPYDFVPDGVVDGSDLAPVTRGFGSYPGTPIGPEYPIWHPNADVNGDGVIDGDDISIVARHFGEADP